MKKILVLLVFVIACLTSMAQLRLSNKPPRMLRVHDSIVYIDKQFSPEEMATFKKKAQELHVQRQIRELEELYREWKNSSTVPKRVIEVNIMQHYSQLDRQLLRPNKKLYIFMKTLYDEPLEW